MPNVNILDAVNNLHKAASLKRDEKRQLLSKIDALKRDTDKQVSAKQQQLKLESDRATRSDLNRRVNAQAAENVRRLKREVDELKRNSARTVSDLQTAATQLEQVAIGLDNEANALQAIA